MKTILVTGARTGIGRALTERAASRGDLVFAGVRKEADFKGLPAGENVIPIVLDVSSSASVTAAFERVDAVLDGRPLEIVINCAAICPLGAVEVEETDLIMDTLNTNTGGSVRMLKASLPRLRGHNGRIALVTSLWGRVAGPMLSAYASSKFAIEAIADSARRETHGHDNHIILIEPGVVRTKMVSDQVAAAKAATEALTAEHKDVYTELYSNYHNMIEQNSDGGVSADQCAAAIEKAVFARKPKARYRVGMDSKVVSKLARFLPDSALDAMFRKLIG